MNYSKRMLVCLALMLAVLFCFTACGEQIPEETENPNAGILTFEGVITADRIGELNSYPDLQSADLRGSTCYREIADYAKSHPEVSVRYSVALGSEEYESTITELTVSADNADFDQMMENLAYLPGLTSLTLEKTTFTTEQLDLLRTEYPAVSIDYSIAIGGTEYSAAETELDLSAVGAEHLSQIISAIGLLPDVNYVNLVAEDGSTLLSIADVKQLQESASHVFFNYSFDLFGQTVSTADEQIIYDEVDIGNEGEAEIREALDILSNCSYIKFDDCGIDSTVMAGIRDDYPDTKVVWRIHVDYFSMCTDETMIRMTHGLDDGDELDELRYCTEVTYMDLGHNTDLTNISFVEDMPLLECVIVSGAPLSDISYFKDHDSLIWLELAFCSHVADLSVLSTCDNLKYLNVSYSQVSDLSPLDNLKLDRMNCMNTNVMWEEENRFIELHPDCITLFEGQQPYGYGWRYDDYGYTFFEYYANMRKVFRYDEKTYWGNHKEK